MTNEAHENVLPPSVKKQVDQADAIIAKMNQQPEPTEPAPTEPAPTEPAPTEPAPTEPAPTEPAPTEPPKEPAREDWKQKYHVLKGKYDAEVPRLSADLRDARNATNSIRDELSKLQTTVAALKELQKTPQEPTAPAVSQEEIEQFGPDLIDVIERKAREVADRIVAERVGKVEKDVRHVNETVASQRETAAKSDRERLYDRLDSEVQGWDVINTDEKFVAWLKEDDGLSGIPRGANLRSAFERNDAVAVIKYFKSFQKEHAVGTPDPDPAAPAAPAEPQEPAPGLQTGLDDLVAPGTPKTGPTDAQDESGKRIWTQADIHDFHVRKNEIVRRSPNKPLPKELAAEERDLFKAQSEGRIRI